MTDLMKTYEVITVRGTESVKANGVLVDDTGLMFFEDKACNIEPMIAAYRDWLSFREVHDFQRETAPVV